MKNKDIYWLIENYTESRSEMERLLLDAERKCPATIDEIIEGCKILHSFEKEKPSLKEHLKIIGEMSMIGIKASNMGSLLRKAISIYANNQS